MNRTISTGTVIAVLAALVLLIAGAYTFKGRQDKQAAQDRRSIILQGAGGEKPPGIK